MMRDEPSIARVKHALASGRPAPPGARTRNAQRRSNTGPSGLAAPPHTG